MDIPIWLCWLIEIAAAYLVARGLWNGYSILFRCPKRGDVIRYINRQNGIREP